MDSKQHERISKSHDFAISIKNIAASETVLTPEQQRKIFEYAEQVEHFLKPIVYFDKKK